MTLFIIIKRFEGKEMPRQLRRKAWKGHETCFCNGAFFYNNHAFEETFAFSVEDLAADDWEYTEKAWVSK